MADSNAATPQQTDTLSFEKLVLRKNGSPRRQFRQWQVPKSFRKQYPLKDGDLISVHVHCGNYKSVEFERYLASGCEFVCPEEVATRLRQAASRRQKGTITFYLRISKISKGAANSESVLDELDNLADLTPSSTQEAQKRIDVSIRLRQGQARFRKKLLELYGFKCAISGCDCVDALEAAHIEPYNGTRTNNVSNGVLLRADLHTLYDKKKLWIDDLFRVHIHRELVGTTYASLQGTKIFLPAELKKRPKFKKNVTDAPAFR